MNKQTLKEENTWRVLYWHNKLFISEEFEAYEFNLYIDSSKYRAILIEAHDIIHFRYMVLKDKNIVIVDGEDYFYNNPNDTKNKIFEENDTINEHSHMSIYLDSNQKNTVYNNISIERIPCNAKTVVVDTIEKIEEYEKNKKTNTMKKIEITKEAIDNGLMVFEEIKNNPYLSTEEVKGLGIPYATTFLKTAEKMGYVDITNEEAGRRKKILKIEHEPYHIRKLIEHNIKTNRETNKKYYKNPADSTNKKFKKPTIEEIESYCKERGNTIDAKRFFNYYESKGWVVGKVKMRDWRAAVRTWEINQKNYNPEPKTQSKSEQAKTELTQKELETVRKNNDKIGKAVRKTKLDPSKKYRLKQMLSGVIFEGYKLQYKYMNLVWRDTGMKFKSVDEFKNSTEYAEKNIINL